MACGSSTICVGIGVRVAEVFAAGIGMALDKGYPARRRRSCAGDRCKDRNQLRCAAIRSLTRDGNSTSGRWPQPASMTRRACGNAAASSSAFAAAGVRRLAMKTEWKRLSAEAFSPSVAAAPPLPLGRALAVESREAAGQDSRQALAVGTCLPVLAHRDERHVFPELLLQIDADPLLLLQIGRGEPGGAKFLACRRYSER